MPLFVGLRVDTIVGLRVDIIVGLRVDIIVDEDGTKDEAERRMKETLEEVI